MNSGNRGIIISGGGKVTLGTVAVGDNARAESTVHQHGVSLEQLRQETERLLTAYSQARGALSPDDEQTAAALRGEVRKDRPDKSILRSLLKRLGSGAETIHSITTAIASVKEMVELIPM